MKKAAFLIVFCSLIGVAHAAPPSEESILKLMSALQLQKQLDQTVAEMDAGMKAALKQQAQGKEVTPVLTAQVKQLEQKMSATIKDELSFARMKDIYLKVYAETFTQEEVNSIIAFYTSPAGKAMMEKTPVATKKASALLRERMEPTLRKIRTMQQDFIREEIKPN